jgi:hypothetical protein
MSLGGQTCDAADEAAPNLEQVAAVTYGYVAKSRPFRNTDPIFLGNHGS